MIPAIEYIERFLYIKTKEGNLSLLKLNVMQKKFYDIIKAQVKSGKPVRIIVLKARQLGFSTFIEALIFYFTACQFAVNSFIVAHQSDSSNAIYAMAKLFYDMLPVQIKPMIKYNNAKMIEFDNPERDAVVYAKNPGLKSSIKVASAESSGIGRGMTFRYVHLSEYAFWKKDKKEILTGILQAVPNTPGTMVFIESTANGYEHFQELWQDAVDGKNGFIPVFFAWHDNPLYTIPYTGFDLDQEELQLKERFNLTDDQLEWRRWCIKTNCSNDIDQFRQEYPSFPEEAFLMSGRPVFDMKKVQQRILQLQGYRPCKRGRFYYDYDGLRITNIRFVEETNGPLDIFVDVEDRHPYVLGGDTAGEGSDSFVGDVMDNITGKQVARFWSQVNEGEYVRQMYCLGKYYNWALVGIEVNFSTYPQQELERLEYPNFYVREMFDTYQEKFKKAFGFQTSAKTRRPAIDNMKEYCINNIEHINDIDLLREMRSFVYNDTGRPEAAEGAHDDLVMGHAITLQLHISGQQSTTLLEAKKPEPYSQIYEEEIYGDYSDIYDY